MKKVNNDPKHKESFNLYSFSFEFTSTILFIWCFFGFLLLLLWFLLNSWRAKLHFQSQPPISQKSKIQLLTSGSSFQVSNEVHISIFEDFPHNISCGNSLSTFRSFEPAHFLGNRISIISTLSNIREIIMTDKINIIFEYKLFIFLYVHQVRNQGASIT